MTINKEDLKALNTKIDNLAIEVNLSSNWKTPSMFVSILAVAATALGLPIMIIAWLEPHLRVDLNHDASIEITQQLKEPLKQIGDLNSEVSEIKGKLEVLDPLIREMVPKRFQQVSQLDQTELKAKIPEVTSLASIATASKIKMDPAVPARIGESLLSFATGPDSIPAAWPAVVSLVNYRSVLNANYAPEITQFIPYAF